MFITTRHIIKTYQRSLFLTGSTTILSDQHKERVILILLKKDKRLEHLMTATESPDLFKEYCMLITLKSHDLILHYA